MNQLAGTVPRLVGMVHLGSLPGSPRFDGDFDAVVAAAVADATVLTESGFDALGVENLGDAPFFADDVPKVTVACMASAIRAMREASPLPVMVNVLRNDGPAALAIAAATGAEMIRVNVLSGSMWTDQGLIHGRAAEISRARRELAPHVRILADVFVKHATPPPGVDLRQATLDLVERGGADAVVVSGSGTGMATDVQELATVRATVGETPVFVGSGATVETVATLLETADGVIVGTALKSGDDPSRPVDPERTQAFVEAAAG